MHELTVGLPAKRDEGKRRARPILAKPNVARGRAASLLGGVAEGCLSAPDCTHPPDMCMKAQPFNQNREREADLKSVQGCKDAHPYHCLAL